MAATNTGSVVGDATSKATGHAKTAADRANSEAAKLLKGFNAAKPTSPDNYMPNYGMAGGGDIHLQPGLYTGALVGPGVWPTESENELAQAKTKLKKLSDHHQQAADEAKRLTDEVFSQHWTDGDGAEAAYEHHAAEQKAHMALVDVLDGVADTNGRLGEHIRLAKRNIRDAHDTAHREIEDYLKAPGGVPTAQIAVITTKYRTLIEGFRGQLVEQVGDETTALTNKFGNLPEGPPGSPRDQDKPEDADGRHHTDPTDGSSTAPVDNPIGKPKPGDAGYHKGDVTDSPGSADAGGQGAGLPDPLGTGFQKVSPGDAAGAAKPPSMPSMPSPPSMGGGSGGGSGGGGSSPLSSLGGGMQGMSGGAKGAGGLSSPASGMQGPASGASPASLGSEFGRGMAAGNAAAGGMPPLSSAPPQAPSGPLSAAPLAQASAPASAAPTASTVPASATPSAGSGGTGMGGIPAGGLGGAAGGGSSGSSPQMTSYGSVLPPSAAGAAAVPGSAGGSVPSAPAPAAGGAGPAPGSPGFLPGLRDSGAAQRVGRDVSMTDLETARAAVADLAAASSVIYPGLEWAVAVSRGASGFPEMWVTTNEGAGYIPSGVYIPRSMPLAAHFDSDFDARWFGWFNPAETVLRAVRVRGDALSAIATTWAQDSEDVRSATPDVAIGVTPLGAPGEAGAAMLTRGRSHRLETIAPAVFSGLQRDPDEGERYARQLTQQVVFSGPEMSPAAMSVARAVIANQWPSDREWEDLNAQYEMDRLMAGSQRPGLMGVEEPHQLAAYQHDFAQCRRLETLLCWQSGNVADVVYAAITAGVTAPAFV